jgi:hypothetical protein
LSAFLCSDESLLVLVHAAMNVPHGLSWYWGKREEGYQPSKRASLKRMDYEQADRVLKMLRAENVRSLVHRYPDDAKEFGDLAVLHYPPTLAFQTDPTPVEVLKTIHCLDYQSCEHDGWPDSEACAFLRSLERAMIRELPGYDNAAGWDWTPEEFQKRRGNVISLSGLMAQQRRARR